MLDTINESIPMTIADRIRQLRKDHALTQDDLAAKTGLSVATIQRIERGESFSANSIASIASAFGMSAEMLTNASKPISSEPASGSYLPLVTITSGKRLVDLVASASAIDFDYMDVGDESLADMLDRFYQFCSPRRDGEMPSNPAERIRLDMEASRLLKELSAKGLTVAVGTYDRTSYEVDDDNSAGMAILLASWEETCLVIRVGINGVIVDRADIEARMGKWTNTNDPRIVRPSKAEPSNNEE